MLLVASKYTFPRDMPLEGPSTEFFETDGLMSDETPKWTQMQDRSSSDGPRAVDLSLNEWFRFSDRDRYDPTAGSSITTTAFFVSERSNFDAPEWEREEWSVASVLVPLDQDEEALNSLPQRVFANDYLFAPSWDGPETFDFEATLRIGGLILVPWIRQWKHSRTGELVVWPHEEFLLYHSLDERPGEDVTEYVHPLDGITVLRSRVEQHSYFNPTVRVSVHRDYLRDFLAARGACLLVSVVADRFANRRNKSDLELERKEDQPIGENAWLTTMLHSSEATQHGYARGRASLYWNLLVEPYDHPKGFRSPWPRFFDAERHEKTAGSRPEFVIDAEGRRVPIDHENTPLYLFFEPAVLSKYLDTAGYSVFFHMRTWGRACGPGEECVDVGINSEGLATAFAPDIANLNRKDQRYWSHYSSLPSGDVCKELFDTRMQLRPPSSPGVLDVIEGAMSEVRDAFQSRYSLDPFTTDRPSESDAQKMSVGPIRGQMSEVIELAKLLYSWIVGRMRTTILRRALKKESVEYQANDGELMLLGRLVAEVGQIDEQGARRMLAPLTALNELRVASAHRLDREVETVLDSYNIALAHPTPRAAWITLVDAVAQSLQRASEALVRGK